MELREVTQARQGKRTARMGKAILDRKCLDLLWCSVACSSAMVFEFNHSEPHYSNFICLGRDKVPQNPSGILEEPGI